MSNKVGRPVQEDKRTERITLQLTKREKDLIEKYASEVDMVTSRYCREWLLADINQMMKNKIGNRLMKFYLEIKGKCESAQK
jgi:hypothetical protein